MLRMQLDAANFKVPSHDGMRFESQAIKGVAGVAWFVDKEDGTSSSVLAEIQA